ncbi:MAG: hypothetical protein WCK95_15540 [Alphaproteobacteria bacterium]|jgi:hypothetical protein
MKSFLATVLGLCLFASPVVAQNADFTLVNATGYPIEEVYVSPTKSKSWGSDILGKHTVGDGEAWKLSFPQAKNQCFQDLMIVFEDDQSKVVWENFNLCEINKITLTYNRKSGETAAKVE